MIRRIRRMTWPVLSAALATTCVLSACSSGSDADRSTATTSGSSGSASGPATPALAVDQALFAQLPSEIQQDKKVTIGTPLVPPTIYQDEAGKLTGSTYEIVNAMGAVLGVQMEWTNIAFPGTIPGVQSGKFDLSTGIIADTAERQKILDFVDLMSGAEGVLVRASDSDKYNGLDTLCGQTVGALAGGTELALIEQGSNACTQAGEPAITTAQYNSPNDGYGQLSAGRIAGFVEPIVSGLAAVQAAKGSNGKSLFAVGSARYPGNPFAIAMQKDRGTLAKALQGALVKVVQSGQYKAILAKYGIDAVAFSADQITINGAGTAGTDQ